MNGREPQCIVLNKVLALLAKWFDIRSGEGRPAATFALVLCAIIAGHTLLETTRDALFLAQLDPSRLALVYGALAFLAVLGAKLSSALSRRQGEKRSLVILLFSGLVGAGVFFVLPKTRTVVFVFYLWTGVITSVAIAQYWLLATRVLTVAQAKRLLGPIASAGILGGVLGGGLAVLALRQLSTNQLLPIAASMFAVAMVALRWIRVGAPPPGIAEAAPGDADEAVPPLGARYLRLVTVLIFVATMALLCIDYLFKASTARHIESGQLGSFFAAYYAVLNAVAFVFQLALATHLLRRLGVLASVAILPALLLMGCMMAFVVGPALGVVLLVKGADGSMRHSLHRTSTELLWMPLPPRVRGQTKPLVDTFVTRAAQASGAALVFGLAFWQLDTTRVLAGVIVALTALWIGLTVLLRNPYLALFRSALHDERELDGPLRLTIGSLEVLVEALSSMNASRATAAINLLASHGRARLIPALTLFHPEEEVLLSALKHVPTRDRQDWVVPTERLIEHESERVRLAAMSALIEHDFTEPIERRLTADDPTVRGHAAVLLAERSPGRATEHVAVRRVATATGPRSVPGKVAMLQAIRGRDGWTELVLSLLEDDAPQVVEQAVWTAASLSDRRLVPALIDRLTIRKLRDAVREALLAQGEPALEATARLLADAKTPPRLRRHLPRTISRFANQRAADILEQTLESESAGLVRYKALRGLGRLAAETRVTLDSGLLGRLLERNLRECLRMRTVRFLILGELREGEASRDESAPLLLDLLEDKAEQALERAFRTLQLLHPDENIRGVASAIRFGDKATHANALEYLATLSLELESGTRELLRLATDKLEPAAFVEQVRTELDSIPVDSDQALAQLLEEDDTAMRSIAQYHLECRVREAPPGSTAAGGQGAGDRGGHQQGREHAS